ncbi:FtsW/RodA/SpoVE family cell cycle protein [Ruminococcus gauvreauii]|uniref:Probable peptidoglycan glycosyltransferase FtsW n=1 Tax=Ruminococcus gauvreauii TaxID=438033 RepID=A0ABY5VH19_9FIRM|nr:putative peptidoglycan glycosyltransferase FtsW [Ruminococcus gauvreauii]UWP59894.1 putative lipid II flippase FtsW [Ruminococcus gauvreauii]
MRKAIAGFIKKMREKADYYDYNLLAVVILLICFGLVMLYSTSSYESNMKFGDDMYYFRRQALISLASVMVAVILSRIDYHILIKLSGFIFVMAFVLMALVKSPLGVEVNGARRWLKLGIQFQPSEIAKIAVITYLPVVIISMGRKAKSLKAVAVLLFLGALQAGGAYILTDNLSTGLIIGGITVILIFISHPKTAPFVATAGAGAGILAIFIGYLAATIDNSQSFRIRRVLAWLRPEEYSADGGYQVMQALYAIGSGGLFGKGLGNSAQKLGTIPEAQNDMIFSIVCEELGIFGGVMLLLLFAYLLYRLFFIAQNARDLYGSLIVTGIFAHIALQVILNICVVINVIPTTGITLPFISYGGTSVLFLMTEMGIALSVSRGIKFQEKSR